MTVRELITQLQELPEDAKALPVYFNDGVYGPEEVSYVGVSDEATSTGLWVPTTKSTTALYNGQEVVVEFPDLKWEAEKVPGVVIG